MLAVVEFLLGMIAILAISFAAIALLIRLVSRVSPGASPGTSWLWAAVQPLLPVLARLGLARSLTGDPQAGQAAAGSPAQKNWGRRPNRFRTIRDAKDFLAGRIAAEAVEQSIPFSEVERKMLYFSDTGWTLPDMAEVSAEFHRDYNQEQFERKIFILVRKIGAHRHFDNPREKENWDQAVEKVSEGDHYLQVLLNPAREKLAAAARPPHDMLKLWVVAFVIVLALCATVALSNWLIGPRFWSAISHLLK